ncbi:hypothetical protein AB1K54_08705 [Microbacterium sp. BWT-B31]|uniref:hypothetical protein n=1 Tax=Microbacterium sp. BWT-B31 TaxID=3232072 RepID=UPI003527B901
MLQTHNTPEVRAPDRRRLRVFAFDPMRSRLSGQFLELSIPFERKLSPGPVGELFEVVDYDARRDVWYSPVDLDDPLVLAQSGLRPSESDPRSHQQIVYAVAMSVIERFERFTGRRFRWRGDERLRLVPHAFYGRNAFFDPERRAVLFGYFRADETDTEANLPSQLMFTCLSVDIIAHEVTHAIVHRARPLFTIPTNADVFAFHEGFADVIALFHHFLFRDIVEEAVAQSRSELEDAAALFALANEFGHATGRGGPLRSALEDSRTGTADPRAFLDSTEPHERGAIFVSAVFDAFLITFKEQIRDLRRLATGGSGVLGDGELSPDLVRRIAAEASRNAERILGMVVRAFDFMPPVDVTFGDVVRAIITADRDLFPDDALLLRAHLVESFRRRGIFPPGVVSLADQALLWRAPVSALSLATGRTAVDLSQLILDSTVKLDPSASATAVAGSTAQARSSRLYGELFAWAKEHALELGLAPGVGTLKVEGLHVAFQTAVDGQPRPRIIAQVVQRRKDLEIGADPNTRTRVYAGCTIVASIDGSVSYVVPKSLPLADESILDRIADPELAGFVRHQHREGIQRLKGIRDWEGTIEQDDPLASWLNASPLSRLTFANLHAPAEGDE